jgi:hypothetical protein
MPCIPPRIALLLLWVVCAGATAINWYTPTAMRGSVVVSSTFFSALNNGRPLVGPLIYGAQQYTDVVLARNAFVALNTGAAAAPAVMLNFPAPYTPVDAGTVVDGNLYWTVPPGGIASGEEGDERGDGGGGGGTSGVISGGAQTFTWANATYASLSAFRAATGREAHGTDADPRLVARTPFFRACLAAWRDGVYPALPNSPALDAVRAFGGC